MPYIQVRQIAHRGFRTFLLGQDGPNVYTFYNRGLEIFEDVIAKVQRQYFLINYLLNDPGNCQQASYSFSDWAEDATKLVSFAPTKSKAVYRVSVY